MGRSPFVRRWRSKPSLREKESIAAVAAVFTRRGGRTSLPSDSPQWVCESTAGVSLCSAGRWRWGASLAGRAAQRSGLYDGWSVVAVRRTRATNKRGALLAGSSRRSPRTLAAEEPLTEGSAAESVVRAQIIHSVHGRRQRLPRLDVKFFAPRRLQRSGCAGIPPSASFCSVGGERLERRAPSFSREGSGRVATTAGFFLPAIKTSYVLRVGWLSGINFS